MDEECQNDLIDSQRAEKALLSWLRYCPRKSESSSPIWHNKLQDYADGEILLSILDDATSDKIAFSDHKGFKRLLLELRDIYSGDSHSQEKLNDALVHCHDWNNTVTAQSNQSLKTSESSPLFPRLLLLRAIQLTLVICVTGPSRHGYLESITQFGLDTQEVLMKIIDEILTSDLGNCNEASPSKQTPSSPLSPDSIISDRSAMQQQIVELKATISMMQNKGSPQGCCNPPTSPIWSSRTHTPDFSRHRLFDQELEHFLKDYTRPKSSSTSTKVMQLETENNRLQAQCSALKQRNSRLTAIEDEVDSLRPVLNENKEMIWKLKSYERSIKFMQQAISQLSKDTDRESKECKELRKTAKHWEKIAKKAQGDSQYQNIECMELKKQRDVLHDSLENANKLLVESEQQCQQYRTKLSELNQVPQISNHEDDSTYWQKQFSILHRRYKNTNKLYQNKMDKLNDTAKMYRDRMKSLKIQVCALRYEMEDMKTEIIEKDKQLRRKEKEWECEKFLLKEDNAKNLNSIKQEMVKIMNNAVHAWTHHYRKFMNKIDKRFQVFSAGVRFLEQRVKSIQKKLEAQKQSTPDHSRDDRKQCSSRYSIAEHLEAQQALTAKYRRQYFKLNSKYMKLKRAAEIRTQLSSGEIHSVADMKAPSTRFPKHFGNRIPLSELSSNVNDPHCHGGCGGPTQLSGTRVSSWPTSRPFQVVPERIRPGENPTSSSTSYTTTKAVRLVSSKQN